MYKKLALPGFLASRTDLSFRQFFDYFNVLLQALHFLACQDSNFLDPVLQLFDLVRAELEAEVVPRQARVILLLILLIHFVGVLQQGFKDYWQD